MTKFKKALATLMAVACTASALCVPMSVSASATTTISESESNNTISTAKEIKINEVLSGTISSTSDVDYYYFEPKATGYCDITLGVPTGCNYNYAIYDSTGTLIYTVANNASGLGENYRKAVVNGSRYYIKVYSSSGSSTSKEYSLYITPPTGANKTWYSQVNSTVNKHEWNNNHLNRLYGNYSSKVFIDDNYNTPDIMSSGCAISSIAMVLHNMNAKTSVAFTDFRTGFKGYMYADPFTVYLAHNGLTSAPIESNSRFEYNDKSIELRYYDVNTSAGTKKVQNIGSYFNKNIVVHSGTLSDAKAQLSSHPQGVIIRFNKSGNSHYVVMVPSNTDSNGYVIYDPGTQTESKGNGVSLSSSYVMTKTEWGFTTSDVTEYILIDNL